MKKEVKKPSLLAEFKAFAMRGNVLDMAVGVIIGGAFGKIITSLVNDILMPFVGIIIGGHSFTSLSIKVKDSVIMYGSFIQNIIDFLIIAASVFVMVKLISNLSRKEKEEAAPAIKSDETVLLEEIRDLLKKDTKAKEKVKK